MKMKKIDLSDICFDVDGEVPLEEEYTINIKIIKIEKEELTEEVNKNV